MPSYSPKRLQLKLILALLVLFFGIVGLANLQAGAKSETIQRRGTDVMIALDVSNSMLAKDLTPNRLERSKQFVNRILEKLSSHRIGLVVFAGKAYLSVPITTDVSALKMNIATASPAMVSTQGTVLSEAIEMCTNAFNSKELKYKNIILITDGEDHDEDAISLTKKATESGVNVFTIGVGSAQGAPIFDEGTQQNKVDEQGNEIISKLNEAILQEIAQAGNGKYHNLTNIDNTASKVSDLINSSEQRMLGANTFTDFKSYFQYFIGISLLLSIIHFVLPNAKNNR